MKINGLKILIARVGPTSWCAVACLGMALAMSGCGPEPSVEPTESAGLPEPSGVIARLGDRVIRMEDVEREAARRRAQGRLPESAGELLEDMLKVEALAWKARTDGLLEDPEVRDEVDRLLVRTLRRRVLAEQREQLSVTDEELEEAYRARLDTYTRPGMDRLAMLYLAFGRNASEEQKASLRDRLAVARSAVQAERASSLEGLVPGFGSRAVAHSDDQASRYRGGDLGWFARGRTSSRIPEDVLEAGRALEPGTLSPILESGNGYYLVMKTDTRAPASTPFEEVKASLRRQLLAGKNAALEQDFYAACLEQANPVIHEDVLARVNLDTGPATTTPERAPPAMAQMKPPTQP